jgi:hypothetical protein
MQIGHRPLPGENLGPNNQGGTMSARPGFRPTRAASVLAALLVSIVPCALSAQIVGSQQVAVDPAPPARDFSRDLRLKVTKPFTVAAAGDVMIRRPFSMIDDPDVQFLFNLIRGADIAVGNMEGNLADLDHFEGPLSGMMGAKETAPDIKAMGFDLMGRANNHVFDSDIAGLFSTIAQLDAAGIVHAGTGKNLSDARKPAYLETPKGRVSFVSVHSPTQGGSAAGRPPSDEVGNIGGRAGMNALGTTMTLNVTREALEDLKKVRREMFTAPPGTTALQRAPEDRDATRIQVGSEWFQVGKPGTKSFTMNESDLEGILRSVSNGKTLSDFSVMQIHAHQSPLMTQQWLFEDWTPDFLIEFAHQSIEHLRRLRPARPARHRDLQGQAGLLRARRVLLPVAAVDLLDPDRELGGDAGPARGHLRRRRRGLCRRPSGPVREPARVERLRQRPAGRGAPLPGQRELQRAHLADRHADEGSARDGEADPRACGQAVRAVRHADRHRERRRHHPRGPQRRHDDEQRQLGIIGRQ